MEACNNPMSTCDTLSVHHHDELLEQLSSGVLSACVRLGADSSQLPKQVSFGLGWKPQHQDHMADLTFSVHGMVKAFKGLPPMEIAAHVAKEILSELITSALADKNHVCLYLMPTSFAGAAIKDVLNDRLPTTFCVAATSLPNIIEPKHWLLEFSSPNTNKPQHLGHVRNNLLGESCARLLSMQGHKVTKVNLVNDRGIHICKSMLAYKKWGEKEEPNAQQKGDHLVGKYYVEFEKHFQREWEAWLSSEDGLGSFQKWQTEKKGMEAKDKIKKKDKKAKLETNPEKRERLWNDVPDLYNEFKKSFKDFYFANISSLGLECNQMLQDWEAAAEGDNPNASDVYQLWQTMNSWVLAGFQKTYDRMGIAFDHIDYESLTYNLGKSICMKGVKDGVMHLTDTGAVAVDYAQLPALKLQGEKVLLRSNGTSVYMTQDLGTAFMRWDKFGAEKMGYVVASEQREHFNTLFELLALLRPETKHKFTHLSYGMVNLTTGRMKSREGTVVDADNLMDELQEMAAQATSAQWPELSAEEVVKRAEKIGLAALKFFILSSPPENTMLYDPKASIKFEGKTGPYLLYSYARTRSILRKCMTSGQAVADATGDISCLAALGTAEEKNVIRCLFNFNSSMHAAAIALDPAKICNCLFALAQAFNTFFKEKATNPIKDCQDVITKQARLLLTETVGVALRNGLGLLGIETIESM